LPGLIELLDRIDFDTIYTIGFTTPEYMGYYIDEFHPVPDVALISQTVDAVFTAPTADIATAYGTMPQLCSWQ
jgi:hypothetical protein